MRFILPFLTISLIVSCASAESGKSKDNSTQQQQVVKPIIKNGKITDLYVSTDANNSFSVYLPANYDSTKKWPLVIFFDAHANGKLPLNNYKAIADKWGYIFVGSNSSKNGLDMQTTKNIGEGLLNEVKKILPIDQTEIILCGFSGGSRVAAFMTAGRSDVKGVICNSAAPQAPLPGKVFVGLAGLGDMNYLEMKTFCDRQVTNTSPHELLVFNGKHEWAPATMMEDALLIESISPVNGISNIKSNEMYRALGILIINQADSIEKTSCMVANNLMLAGERTQSLAVTGNQRIVVGDDYRISVKKNNSCVKTDEASWQTAEKLESGFQQEISSSLMSQDTTWWQNNIDRLFESKKDAADKFMHQRLRGYASLVCYSYANQAFKSNNLHAAEKLIAEYSIVDPTNSEWAYMRANLYVQIGMNDYAIASLEKAVEIGFNDKARLLNDPIFLPLQADPKFAAVLDKLK